MPQTRRLSALEAVTNVLAGFGLALALQMSVFPLVGVVASAGQNLQLAGLFTLASLIRSYALRRLFERLGRCKS